MINIEEREDRWSVEQWEGFNHHLTRKISGGLFEEKKYIFIGGEQDQLKTTANPTLKVKEYLALTPEDTHITEEPASAQNST